MAEASRELSPPVAFRLRVFLPLLLYTLPFDALPFLPSHYRPFAAYLSFALLAVALGWLVFNRMFDVDGVVVTVSVFFFYSVGISALKGVFLGKTEGAVDYALSFTVGYGFFLVVFFLLSEFGAGKSPLELLKGISRRMVPLYFVAALFGVIEMAELFAIGPARVLSDEVSDLLSGDARYGVQWFSREPAWGALQILFFIPFLRLYAVDHPRFRPLISLLYLELLFTLSTTALVSLVLVEGTLFLIKASRDLRKLLPLIVLVVSPIVAIGVLLNTPLGEFRQIKRFRSLYESVKLEDFLRYSSSETIRIGFPAAAILELEHDPFLGVGGGNSRYYIRHYIYDIMPWARNMPEVRAYADHERSAATPRNLYARIIGETGLIGLALFIILLFQVINRIRLATAEVPDTILRDTLIRMGVTLLMINLQFDSMSLQQNWLILAVFAVITHIGTSHANTDSLRNTT